jgi:hypothetical protein
MGRALTGVASWISIPERAFAPNGRGIALSRQLSFASLTYLPPGNQVVVTVPKPVRCRMNAPSCGSRVACRWISGPWRGAVHGEIEAVDG